MRFHGFVEEEELIHIYTYVHMLRCIDNFAFIKCDEMKVM